MHRLPLTVLTRVGHVAALGILITIPTVRAQFDSTAAPRANLDLPAENSSAHVPALLQSISSQLRSLHAEILECRLEILEAKLPGLERELQQAQGEQQQLEEEQRLQTAEAAQTDLLLTQQNLTTEERQTLEARRAELVATTTNKFQSAQASLTQREAQARERLVRQQQRMQLLLKRAREFMPDAKR